MAGMSAGGGGGGGAGALQQQLGLIMAALTKAAVAEICAVVDEGYAALQLEITRSHRENQALKKKLHLIQSIVARSGGGGGGHGGGAGVGAAAELDLQAEEGPQLRRDGDGGAAAATLRAEPPEVVLIKDEDSDCEESFPDDHQSAGDGGATPAPSEGGGAPGGGAAGPTPPGRGMKRNRSGNEEMGRRPSPEQLAAKTPQPPSAAGYAPDSPAGEPSCSAHLGGADTEAGDSVCSLSSRGDPDVQLVQQECPPVQAHSDTHAYFCAPVESPGGRAETDLNHTWTKPSKSLVPFPHFSPSEDGDAFGLKLVSVSGSAPSDCQFSESNDSAFSDMMNFPVYREPPPPLSPAQATAAARGKRYVCSVCNKTYATAQNLEVHMRIHTGEKPFACGQCGKKFTQSAHLKSHLSVHSGARPFSCSVCSRSFIIKYSMTLHMKKCHPNA